MHACVCEQIEWCSFILNYWFMLDLLALRVSMSRLCSLVFLESPLFWDLRSLSPLASMCCILVDLSCRGVRVVDFNLELARRG